MFRSARLAFLILATGGVATSQTTVSVPGVAQLGLAGQPAGTSFHGDSAPLNSPVLANVSLVPGKALQITASGIVGGATPDGLNFSDSTGGSFGIGQITATRSSLIGVFLGAVVNSSATPPNVDYVVGAREVDVLTPMLQQPFLVGNGKTLGGGNRTIIIPVGATQVLLGVTGYSTATLTGSFTATVSIVTAPDMTPQNPVKVYGISQLTLAGQPAGTVYHGDGAPLNSPVQVGFPLVAGQAIHISATTGAEGTNINDTSGGGLGIGSISAPRGSVIGVFLRDIVDNTASPPSVDYTGAGRDVRQLMPLLQQPFYVGTGTTLSGACRVIIVPAGATQLFLGTTGYSVAEFSGTVTATVTADSCTSPPQGTVAIPAVAQIGLAGQPAGITFHGDSAPLNSPVLVNVPLTQGKALQITATGVANGATPDGLNFSDSTGGSFGIGQITAARSSLIGVFLGAVVNSSATPPNVDYVAGAREVDVLTPMLQQPFLVGSGKTLGGGNRIIVVPAGATQLLLGVTAYSTATLTGSFTATVSIVTAPDMTPQNPVKVYGISQLTLAGQPAGTVYHGDGAPLNSPVQVGFPLVAGQAIHISATTGAEGTNINDTSGGGLGLGSISAPRGSVIGVFLRDIVDNTASPPSVDYTGAGRDVLQLMPLLQQPFYVGTGTTLSGASRAIIVPVGATRLFLGTTGYSVAESNGTVTAAVTTVVGPLNLQVAPSALSFTSAGSQVATIASGGPTLAFSASVTTNSGIAWLSATPTNSNTPGSIVVSATPGALPPGVYSGTVTITSPNATNSPQTISVTLTIQAPTSVSATPQSLTFEASVDTTAVSPQTVQVSSSTQGTSFSVASIPDAWLAVAPTSGQLPSRLSVSVNPSGLAAGNYSSTIVVQSPGNPSVTIPVSLAVQQLSQQAFDVQAPAMQFSFGSAATNPLARVVSVQSRTDQTLTISARSKNGSKWLSIFPPQTPVGPGQNVDFQVVVTAPTDVSSATDYIVISGGGQSKEVLVTYAVYDGTLPQPVPSSRGITLSAILGQNNLDSKDLLLYNAGSSSLNWSLTQTSIYLFVSQTSGPPLDPNGYKTLTVTTTPNVAGLAQPLNPAPSILFQGWGLNPDVSVYIPVPVYLQILDPKLFPRLPPRASTAGIIVGPQGFTQQTVTLTNSGPQPASFMVTAPGWLSVTPSSGQVQGNKTLDLTVTLLSQPVLDPNGPPPAITVEFPNYVNNKPYDLNVDVVYVTPPTSSTASVSARSKSVAAATACTATRYSAVFTSPGNLFEVPAALPVDIIARVVDDCGNPLSSGASIVTFSTEEPAIALSAWPDGTWRGTWQPLLPQNGLVTLRLVATTTNNLTPARAFIGGSIVASANAPIVLSNSVLNSASQQKNNDTVAPGQIITIYGQNLAAQPQSAPNGIPTTTLGGVQVLFGGNPLPLFYVGPTQINAVVPFTVPVRQSLQLLVQRNGIPSVPLPLTVVATQPGIFTTSQTGSGQGAILGPSGQVVDSQHPAHPGDIVSIYSEGLGAVNPAADVTLPAPGQEPLPRVTGQLSVIIGNASAEVVYAGLAPGFFGLYQINVRVPVNAPVGDTVPVQVNLGNQPSNSVGMAIR